MASSLDSVERVVANRYRLHERLGSGGMGTVWRGKDVVLGRDVAVKEVAFPVGASAADRAVLRERIRREARAAAQLDHPGAVTVHDVVEDGSATYVVMQYVPAQTLSEVIRRDGPLSPQRTARVGLAVLGALRAAHARGIVHRDVKPSNVLLGLDDEASPDRVFLTDFGIASAPGDSSLTSSGLLIGSPGYIAPERARGDVPGPASDLWSLGATLFTAVEGHPPYDGDDPMATLTAVMVGEHAPYVRAGPLQPVLAGLLERDPAKRIMAAQLATALAEVATSAVSRVATVPSPLPAGAINPDASAGTAVLHVGEGSPIGQAARPAAAEVAPLANNSPVAPLPLRPVPPSPVPLSPVPLSPEPLSPGRPAAAVAPVRRRSPKSQRRPTWLAWASLSVAVVLGLAAFLIVRAADGEPPAGPGAADPAESTDSSGQSTDSSDLPALPATAVTPIVQLRLTIAALTELAMRDPDLVGPGADQVLESLRGVELLDGALRRSAAVAANTSVGGAVAAGDLRADVGQRVQEVLDRVARPERLVDLVELVAADPLAIGSGGPALLDPLVALDHQVPADQTAASAADLLQSVTDGVAKGELSEAFETAAVPMLEELADPASYGALQDLVADVEGDPSSIGSAAQQVLASLRAIAELPVFDQGNEAQDLLRELVPQDGRVTSDFRDAAIPVLVSLVR